MKKRLRNYLPYLEIYVSLPLLRITTELMNERVESMTYTYISLNIRLWKWEGHFRLYAPREWYGSRGDG
jgi:hypothetical protein